MSLSLKPRHLKRYAEVARLLLKYGRSDLVKSAGLDAALTSEPLPEHAPSGPSPEDLAADLEKMGPTFIKLGQLLSTRGDLLPVPYLEALARLQDSLEPFPAGQVEEVIAAELGFRVSKGFGSFDPTPLATASLGQVHRATMRDGRPVAVKVQRPGIRQRLQDDLDALEDLAGFLDRHTEIGRKYRFLSMLDEFRRSLLRELDYRQEAQNLVTLAKNLEEFDRIVVPLPIGDYTTPHVLTMEYIEGQKITTVSPLTRVEIGGAELADQLFRAYLKQVLVDGFLHADPHPGNVFLTQDCRVALLDLGMVVHLAPDMQQSILSLLLAVSEGNGQEAAKVILSISETDGTPDRARFERQLVDMVSRHKDASIEEIEIGGSLLQAAHFAVDSGIRFPPELTMVGQTLLKLDHAGRVLDPGFKPNASIRQNAIRALQKRAAGGFSLGKAIRTAMDMKDFVTELPGRVNSILDALAGNELEVRIKTLDEERLTQGFQKIANRITAGLVLAALIVGAALLMRVETSFRILGYPGLAMLFFLAAGLGGFALLFETLIHDRERRPRLR